MLRLYYAQRRRGGDNPHGVSSISIGDIYYFQDGVRPLGNDQFRYRSPIRKNPWIVVAFLNRKYYPAVRGGRPVIYMRGGVRILVRSLRDGRYWVVGAWFVHCHEELGLDGEPGKVLPIPVLPGRELVPAVPMKRKAKTKAIRLTVGAYHHTSH